MGRGQELLEAARKADRSTVEKIIGQITKRSGPFPSIRRGPGVNVKDDNGYTPLHHACLNGHEDIVQLLLSADASPNAVDKIGATPLHLATFNGHSRVVAMLLAHNNPPVNIDQLTLKHDTALQMAAEFGLTDVVSMLVSRGADVTIQNSDKLNALDLAVQFGKKDVVKLLLRMRPQLIDQYRMPVRDGVVFQHTPLHLASKHGREDVVRELLAAGVDPNLRTEEGTPLHVAACFARDSVVRLLLRRGADLKSRDIRGRTVMQMLAGYSEESTRSVRQVIQDFKSQRCSYESDEDLPPFPVLDSPPAPPLLKPNPSLLLANKPYMFDFIEPHVTNANTPFSKPPSPSTSSGDLCTDYELIIRTDSFLAEQKKFKKVTFDVEKAESKVYINHCGVISQIKSINQALASNTIHCKPSILNKTILNSSVYENVVYNWPKLNSDSYVRYGMIQNEYYKPENVNKFSGINSLEKKAKEELHREQNRFHGAKVNQINPVKNVINSNDCFNTNRSPDLNRERNVRRDTIDHKYENAKQVNRPPARDIIDSPIRKVSSQSDFSRPNISPKLKREPNFKRGTIDNDFKKTTNINQLSPSMSNMNKNTSPYIRRVTLDNEFKKKVYAPTISSLPKNNSLPKFYDENPFRCVSVENEYEYLSEHHNLNSKIDSNSIKKKPLPLPKPKVTNEISNAIDKLNYRQKDAPAKNEPCEIYEELNPVQYINLYPNELIYENLPSNMPDDMKAHMSTGETSESMYLPMEPVRPSSTRKRFASDFVPTIFSTLHSDYVIADRISLSYDYVPIDGIQDFCFKDTKLSRTLSIPNLMFGERSRSMHLRGSPGCRFEAFDYHDLYVLDPRTVCENVHPFIKKREKASPMPCYCYYNNMTNESLQTDKNESQLLFYSCENVTKDDTDYYSVDEVHRFDQPDTNDLVFTPFEESNASSPEQADDVHLERKLTGIFKKKVQQIKLFVTDWSTPTTQKSVDPSKTAPETQEISNKYESFLSPSSSSLTKIHPQSFVKKLASKCLGLKAKFNSAPNISNGTETEVEVASKRSDHKNSTSNTLLIGNSKFFKILSKKEESGEIVCNDEFDTISLDRLGTLNRDSVVNRSNRSCPGFKTSLPNISENNELSDQKSIAESLVITELCYDKNKIQKKDVNEALNVNINIFEPRDRFSVISNKSSGSATLINECYESYEFKDTELRITNNTMPRPLPRPNLTTASSNENLIYENLINIKSKPTPAARTHIPVKLPLDEVEKKVLYENVTLLRDKKPDPPKRTLFPNQIRYESLEKDSSRSVSRSSTSSASSDSMVDESNLEDILLSAKSKSFRHGQVASYYSGSYKSTASRTKSNASNSSEGSDVSAIENVDCSEDVAVSKDDDENKAVYLSMVGTLPNKKSEEKENKKVLFRHKTFTNIEVDRNSVKVKDLPQWNNNFLKETLAHYHIRGTGHCIYKAPTVQEFMFIFNRDTLYKDVAPFTKVPTEKRDSYFETAICFCKPIPPKHHKSAEDLLASGVSNEEEEKVSIDYEALQNRREIFSTSFKCFCESGTCKFHSKRRETLNDLVVKFSAIKRSISTPDITLGSSPYSTSLKSYLPKNASVPQNLEEPYAVVNVDDIVKRNKSIERAVEQGYTLMSHPSTLSSHPSTLSSNSSARPYSIKDIAEVISLNRSTSTASTMSTASDVYLPVQKSSSSEYSGHWSLQSCNSNVTIKSDLSFKSCLEESSDDGSDGTLHSDDDSDAETIKSDISTAKRPWLHSDSFRFGSNSKPEIETIAEESQSSFEDSKLESMSSKFESGISVEGSESSSSGGEDDSGIPRSSTDVSLGASLERGSVTGGVRSGSGRRRWDDLEGTSEGDALSISSAASSCAPLHLMHHYEHSKVSPTPPKKPPRRNLSVSPTHANSPSSGYSYELRIHARSQDDLDDIQGAKHYFKHGRSVDHYESKLSYSEYEENHNSPRVKPVPTPRPSLKQQPVAITAMYENVAVKEQNPRRKLRRNIQPGETYEPRMNDRVRKYSNQERSSLESLLDDQSMNSPSDCERNYDGPRVEAPLSPSHYEQPPTPDHPPPSAKQAENSIHERIRPLSQEYKRRSTLRDSYTETEVVLLRAPSAASVASGATDRSGNTDNCVEEYVCDVPFAGLFKGSTTTLDGIGLRPMPAERPKTLRKLKSVYDSSPTEPLHPLNNGVERSNEDEVRRRSNTTSSNHSADKSLSILSPFDEQEEWAKISEIMASFGSKLVRESVFVSELEQEFTSRLGLSCSESSLSPSVASNLGLWLAGIGLHDYESLFLEGGYDDIDFVNGVLDENDLREMGIEESDRQKIIESSKQLPLKITEISNNHNNNNISNKNQNESVDEWLRQINLEQYSDTFRKHLYVDMDRVRRIWEVELTAVLEINKAGHRKRILASVSGEQNGPINNHMEDINTDLSTLKNNIKQLKDEIKEKVPVNENLKHVPPPVVPTLMPPGGETLKRSKKNRPAPQPPRPSDLEIRAPSELLVGVPGALKTQWKHQPFVLVTGAVTYVANYLGSTVVKELKGTESTKKSIQKLKKTTKEPRDSPDIILSISYRGVKFLNTVTRELVCEHEIRNIHCACQDADDLTHFAYITKDHTTKSHYCHVFRVATMDQATEVILTLGEAFEVAYQMALREQSNRTRVTQTLAKTPTHDPMTTSNKEKPIVNHGRSHSITEIKLNGHQLKIAPLPASLSNEDFQAARSTDGTRSPRTPLLKAPIASTEEL